MFVVLSLESVNISFMLTNATISDIIKDFIALLIISDFDDYFFMTVSHTPFGKLIKDGELVTPSGNLSLEDILKIERTTSTRAPSDQKIAHTFKHEGKECSLEFGNAKFKGGPWDGFNCDHLKVIQDERKVFVAFEEREFWNKVCRVIYRIFDVYYQSIWYYFAPFIVLYLSYFVPFGLGGYEAEM